MTDYQPLIARAVEGLGKSTGEARRGLYERARSALVTQLRSVDPPLSESDITRERLALEEAIRKVEADAARKARLEARTESRFEPRPLRPAVRTAPPPAASPSPPPPPAPPPPAPPPQQARAVPKAPVEEQDAPWYETPREAEPKTFAAAAQTEPEPQAPAQPPPRSSPPTARGRLLGARTPPPSREGIRGFRNVVNDADDLGSASAKAARSARETRDTYEPLPRQINDDLSPPPSRDRFEPKLNTDELHDYDSLQQESLEPSFHLEDDEPPLYPGQSGRRAQPPRPPAEDDEYEHTRPPRSYVGIIRIAVIGCIVGILAAVFAWQWPNVSHLVARFGSHAPAETAQQQQPAQQPKFSGRVPQDQNQGQSPGTGAPATGDQAAPAVAQRVVLYEEDPNDPQGRRFVGSAIWRTETVSPGPGLAPELAVRADIEIPDRRMTVTWSLRRNTDKALPASHTIEIMFNLPSDFPGGGIANVPGVLMKQAEQARGTPLAGLAVKVTNGFFLIGLSAVDADKQRNLQLLKDQEWFDIPVVYTNGGRAILAVEKGPPGDRAFNDAFNAWSK
jgi:hypothetical protein